MIFLECNKYYNGRIIEWKEMAKMWSNSLNKPSDIIKWIVLTKKLLKPLSWIFILGLFSYSLLSFAAAVAVTVKSILQIRRTNDFVRMCTISFCREIQMISFVGNSNLAHSPWSGEHDEIQAHVMFSFFLCNEWKKKGLFAWCICNNL